MYPEEEPENSLKISVGNLSNQIEANLQVNLSKTSTVLKTDANREIIWIRWQSRSLESKKICEVNSICSVLCGLKVKQVISQKCSAKTFCGKCSNVAMYITT